MDFPENLSFTVSTLWEPEAVQAMVKRWFPHAQMGVLEDLNRNSAEWPDLVVRSRHLDPEKEPGAPGTVVEFVLFPDIIMRERMLSAKLAMLQMLAREAECRVYADAHYYTETKDYTYSETFLCTGGRLYTARVSWQDLYEVPPGQWIPLDGLPITELDDGGILIDSETTEALMADWIHRRTIPEPVVIEQLPYEQEDDTPQPSPEPVDSSELPFEDYPEQDENGKYLDPYLEKLDAWERGYGTSYSKQLIGDGVQLPPADQLDDDALHGKLWEIIKQLAQRQTYLYCTNHLSDRELYEHLWKDTLNHDAMDIAGIEGAACHLDLLGSGSEDDKDLMLKYYDSPEERANWWVSWPRDVIPAHENPPFDRDRHLPKREYF